MMLFLHPNGVRLISFLSLLVLLHGFNVLLLHLIHFVLDPLLRLVKQPFLVLLWRFLSFAVQGLLVRLLLFLKPH
jgi:hypothetical protein